MKKKWLLLLLLFFPGISQAHTLTSMLTEVRVRIKDTSTTRQRYTDTQLTNLLNEGVRDVVTNTWLVDKSTTITLVSGTTYYTLPTDMIVILRVTFRNQNLYETSLIKLDSDFQNSAWATTSGYPQVYFQDSSQSDKIGVYPWPNSSSSTGTLVVQYSYTPPDLATGTDVPYNGELRYTQYQDLPIFYTAYRVYLIEGEVDKATLYRQEYESRLKLAQDKANARPNFNPSLGGPSGSR